LLPENAEKDEAEMYEIRLLGTPSSTHGRDGSAVDQH